MTSQFSRSWINSSLDDIDNSFMGYCSTGGRDLYDEIPKELFEVYNETAVSFWCFSLDTCPQSIDYPSWNMWHSSMHDAVYQLRWELLTDPKQGSCLLGRYYSSTLWQESSLSRNMVRIRKRSVPGLSKKCFFDGQARVLLEVHGDRSVYSRILHSTLSERNTTRLIESIQSLNGHPVVSFPVNAPKFDSMTIIYNLTFRRRLA